MDFSQYFMNYRKSDFMININEVEIPVNRFVLSLKSGYFEAMFRTEMIEKMENKATIKINETELQAFIFVLKLSYGCAINEDAWILKSISDVIQSLIIANEFLFCEEIVKLLSEEYFKKLQLQVQEPTHQTYSQSIYHNLSLICETYKLANFYNFQYLLSECHHYFDRHASHVLLYFESHPNYPIVLLKKILERNSFGVEELSIFNLIKKLIKKRGIEATKPLVDVIRFSRFSFQELSFITKSGVLDGIIGDSILKFLNTSQGSCSRFCYEMERTFQTDDICHQKALLSRSSSFHLLFNLNISLEDLNPIELTIINLPIETLINHITIDIVKPAKYDLIARLNFLYYYKIVLYSSDGQKSSYKYFIIPILDLQDLYFEPKLVSYVHIYCDNKISIESMSYELTKNVNYAKFVKNI